MTAPDTSRYTRIKISRESGILTATLSNPGKKNAVDAAMHRELADLFHDIAKDDETNVVVLTGEGDAFCAGGDIGWMKESASGTTPPSAVEGKRIVFGLLDLEKPIIARVRGPAVGLGATLALFCDCVFAGESARFADPHVRVGLVAGDGGAVIWPALIGFARAKEYLMTGDAISAADAARIGLINHCVPDAELDATVAAFAKRLAEGPTQAIRYTKVSINIALRELAHKLLDASMAYEMGSFATSDHREAVAAFLEKRAPKFTGR
jgi:enoyl-CoA hydratase